MSTEVVEVLEVTEVTEVSEVLNVEQEVAPEVEPEVEPEIRLYRWSDPDVLEGSYQNSEVSLDGYEIRYLYSGRQAPDEPHYAFRLFYTTELGERVYTRFVAPTAIRGTTYNHEECRQAAVFCYMKYRTTNKFPKL